MTARPEIVKLSQFRTGYGSYYLHPFLKNTGDSLLTTGTVIAHQTCNDGTVQRVNFYNNTPLKPGEITKLSAQVFDAKCVQLLEYEINEIGNKQSLPLKYTLVRKFILGWRLMQ